MKKLYLIGGLVLLVAASVLAQNPIPATLATARLEGFNQRKALNGRSLLNQIPFRSVGPTVMSGRVTDIDVSPYDPSIFYVAYASGGLWKTENNGTSFVPIFDQEVVMTIGDVAVNWESNVIWIGTGENNSSRSSYAGAGIYKSTDGGKTWDNMGLPESQHIGRIVLHPSNPNVVWVAVLGHLYSPNPERGIYKTNDGGKTWSKTLFVGDNTGVVDMVIDPRNPDVLYAAAWERQRRAWNFWEGGEGSSIYKSMDGGNNWKKMTTSGSGFPIGEGVGRIGLAIYNDGVQSVVYAILDNQFRRKKDEATEQRPDDLTKDQLRSMSKEAFVALEEKKIATFLKQNDFSEKYSAKAVIKMVKQDKIKPVALVEYLEDANSLLFDTPVIGTEVYRSEDDGKTWQKTHTDPLDDIYFSYGYYFGQIRVAQQNFKRLYILGVPILTSKDGGKTWASINGDNVHADHHALWVSPKREGHLVNGNDGGVNISYDNGEHWIKCNTPAVGQFYTVTFDMAEPYNVYGGLQDNGVWVGPSTYKASTEWHDSGKYPYDFLLGGDGMQVAVDTRDNNTIYTGYQFGNYFRIDRKTKNSTYIQPKHELGERPLRFNWQTPILLSSHNQDILYLGSNKLHRSFNKGEDFKTISEDLTKGGIKGDVAFGTLTTISESPLRFGLLYVGSDDGLIHVTQDGGNAWKKITDGLPSDLWVSRVVASQHAEGTVYASLNGYRWDNFTPYLYASTDYGKTWQRIGIDLPLEPINVVREDPKNPKILYVGTDHGVYVSLDGGRSFMTMNKDLPAVAVHDLAIHPRDNDLIVGTHGRSIYIAKVEHLQQLDEEMLAKKLHVFDFEKVRFNGNWGKSWSKWLTPREPEFLMPIFVNQAGKTTVTIKTSEDLILQTFSQDLQKGVNYLKYDLTVQPSIVKPFEEFLNKNQKEDEEEIQVKKADNEKFYLQAGKYKVTINFEGETIEQTLEVTAPRRR